VNVTEDSYRGALHNLNPLRRRVKCIFFNKAHKAESHNDTYFEPGQHYVRIDCVFPGGEAETQKVNANNLVECYEACGEHSF